VCRYTCFGIGQKNLLFPWKMPEFRDWSLVNTGEDGGPYEISGVMHYSNGLLGVREGTEGVFKIKSTYFNGDSRIEAFTDNNMRMIDEPLEFAHFAGAELLVLQGCYQCRKHPRYGGWRAAALARHRVDNLRKLMFLNPEAQSCKPDVISECRPLAHKCPGWSSYNVFDPTAEVKTGHLGFWKPGNVVMQCASTCAQKCSRLELISTEICPEGALPPCEHSGRKLQQRYHEANEKHKMLTTSEAARAEWLNKGDVADEYLLSLQNGDLQAVEEVILQRKAREKKKSKEKDYKRSLAPVISNGRATLMSSEFAGTNSQSAVDGNKECHCGNYASHGKSKRLWYCAVRYTGGNVVLAKTHSLEVAQKSLGKGAVDSIQAIIPISGVQRHAFGMNSIAGDPHTLNKSWDGGSMWWRGAEDINAMRRKCATESSPDEAANKAKAESEEEEAAGILTVNSEMAAGEIEEKLGGDATKVSEDKIAVEGYSFEKDLDGTVTGSYTTAAGLTLEQCKSKCADGTWPGCVGFSRYSASSDTAAASCWWVANVGELSYDDGNNNENMYKLTTRGLESEANAFSAARRLLAATGVTGEGYCTFTKEEATPWWTVHLGALYDIQQVQVYNPSDIVDPSGGMEVFIVQVANKAPALENGELNTYGTHVCGGGPHHLRHEGSKVVPCGNSKGEYVTISIPRKAALKLCEVEVRGTFAGKGTAPKLPLTYVIGSRNNFIRTNGAPTPFPAGFSAQELSAIHIKAATFGGRWINHGQPQAATCIKESSLGSYIVATGGGKMLKVELSLTGANVVAAKYHPSQRCPSIVSDWNSATRTIPVASSSSSNGYGMSSLTLVTSSGAN